ncbi:MAG: DNA polymerase III subunit gamma/tau [Gammaproteobacteria bacterium]|nr:DNA polymerase III subunit gamma/tau [Gammaproteobacteria bacterium]
MSYQVLARKWRPRLFKDMVGQDHVLKVLVNALDSDRLHHAYLFTGTRGVGKTTLARILAKCLNCEAGVSSEPCGQCGACTGIDEGRFVDLIEVDAASRAKVDETRDLMDNVQYAPTAGRYKVYLIDEVHMFSKHSFNALLKTLEEPPAHVKFLLATTEPKRIPITILSRCLQFNLKHLGVEQIEAQLNKILVEEEIPAEDSCTRLIAVAADGSMRDALSLLDQAVSYGDGRLEDAQVRDMLGTIDAEELGALLADIIEQDGAAMFDRINGMAELSPDYDGMLSGLLSILHDTAVAQVLPDDSDIVDETCRGFARRLDKEAVQLYYQIALNGRRDLQMAPDQKTAFEMTMIRMLAFQPWEASGAAESESGRVAGDTGTGTAAPAVQGQNEDTPALAGNDDWHKLIDSMALDGLTKELAAHCTLQKYQGNRICLVLHPDQEHLAATNQKDKLQAALSLRFGAETRLVVVVEKPADETPAQRKARNDLEAKQAALEAVENDPDVKLFMKTFDATIDKESIKYLGSE